MVRTKVAIQEKQGSGYGDGIGSLFARSVYEVELELTEDMLGTVPANREVYSQFIQSKKFDHQKKHGNLTEEELNENELETVNELEEKGWTTFHSGEDGLFIYAYMIKGFLKNAGNVLKDELGIKALRSKIDDVVFIKPMRIYLEKKTPDGILERSLRAMTPRGQRVALARSDTVAAGLRIKFTLKLLNHKEITEKVIETLFEYGEDMGLGQFRNGGYGTFVVKRFEKIS